MQGGICFRCKWQWHGDQFSPFSLGSQTSNIGHSHMDPYGPYLSYQYWKLWNDAKCIYKLFCKSSECSQIGWYIETIRNGSIEENWHHKALPSQGIIWPYLSSSDRNPMFMVTACETDIFMKSGLIAWYVPGPWGIHPCANQWPSMGSPFRSQPSRESEEKTCMFHDVSGPSC